MTLDRESARRAVEEYWLERLSGDSPKISLPILNEKRAAGSTDQPVRAFLQLAIADHIAARLKDIGSHGEVALLVLFLSGLNILLHKYTGVEDVVIGTMSVREEGVKDKIIFCRNHVSGAFTTREFIRRTKANVLEDFNHGDYAFGALYQKLLSTHNADRLELFNVALIYDRLQRKSALLDQFDLVLTLSAQDNGLLLGAEYRSNLYEGDMIQHFCQNLIDFFDRLPDNLDISISHLDVVGAREKEMWLDFNRTQEEFPHDRTIPELFERQVGEKPDGIALRGAKAHQVSYGELNRRANQLARLLRERGVSSGSIVAVMINRSAEMVMALLGILKAGAAYLPIDPQVPRERILTMLKDSDASIVLTEKGVVARNFYTFLQGINDITAEPHFTSPRQQIMNLDHLPIPDRSLVDYETYSRYIGQVMVKNTIALQTARGCPYRCAYCSKIWGKKHVFRSADDVFKEMQTYYDMGVRRFSIFDDIFNLNSENGIRLFELIIRHGLEVQLFFPNGLRGDLLTRDYIDLLVEAGLTTTALALETASPRLQKLINKNLDLDQFRRNAGYFCTRYPQVILELFTIHGFPTETKEEARMTLDFVKSLKWVHFPYIFNLKIYPHTDMARLAMENGVASEEIFRSEDLGLHEPSPTSPFERSFTANYQAEFVNDYFLSRERLLSVLPYQMKVMTRDEMVQKYDSYFPADLKNFEDLLEFLGLREEELAVDGCLDEETFRVADLNEKIGAYFPRQKSADDALRVLLLDLSQYFGSRGEMLYDVVEPPLGAMYVMTYLKQRLAERVRGKILKSRIDFDSYEELRRLLEEFKPDVLGIRTLTFFRDFFHEAVSTIRQWGFAGPIIAGGPYATRNSRTLLQDRDIDVAVISEGEMTLVEIIEKILESGGRLPDAGVLEGIDGIAFVPQKQRFSGKFARQVIYMDRLFAELSGYPAGNPECKNQPTDPAYVMYTSGSTGKPKGVVIEHRSVINVLDWFARQYVLESDSRVLQLTNYTFDPSVEQIFGTLLHGADLCLPDREAMGDEEKFSDFVEKNRIHIVNAVPPLLKELLGNRPAMKSLRAVISGGEKLDDSVKKQIMDKGYLLYNHYGPTETTIEALAEKCSHSPVTLGRPISNTICLVLDRHQKPVPIGVVGELYVAGVGVARGYLNNVDATGERFSLHPLARGQRLYRTGDLVRWLPEGKIEFMGRRDHQVKIRGFRVELGEIEAQLLRHRAVKAAAVIDKMDHKGDRYLSAYYVPETVEQPELLPSVGDYFMWDELLYYAMGHDRIKNLCFKNAIDRLVKGKTVVEIGTGRDMLMARYAIEAGAKRVYAIEILEKYYLQARETLKTLGLEDRIVLIHGDSRNVELPEKIGVHCSNQIGAIGSSEGAVALHNDAWRFLKEDGVVIPNRCTTRIAAFTLPDSLRERPIFSETSRDYLKRIFKDFGCQFDVRLCIRNFPKANIISNDQVFEDICFQEIIAEESCKNLKLTIKRDGRLDGFILWINLSAIGDAYIDNLRDDLIWKPCYIPAFSPEIEVKQGDVIKARGIRTPGEHKTFPSYKITGTVMRSEGGNIDFEYNMPYRERSFQKNPLYRKLFTAEMPGGSPVSARVVDAQELKAYLESKVPGYMIPLLFTALDRLPLTAGGKVDRGALLQWDEAKPVNPTAYQAPHSEVEKELAAVWQQVLGRDKIGVDENFFLIGGDSIKAIQIVSAMNRAGYKLRMGDLFMEPFISRLATKVKKLTVTRDQSTVSGNIPLSPSQREFFAHPSIDGHHYNQAVMLFSQQRLEEDAVRAVFTWIQEHHDALRMTFTKVNGEMMQNNHRLDYPLSLQTADLRGLQDAGQKLDSWVNSLQASIDLETGPLMKLGLFRMEDGDRLLIVIHHLVVDGISWRILFGDIDDLFHRYQRGQPLTLPDKSDSFKTWAERLAVYANGESFLEEKKYWQQLESTEVAEIPTDFAETENLVKDAGRLSFVLEKEETELLLTRANEAFATEINDILMTALGLGIRDTFGLTRTAIALEGHGREDILPEVDVSRTLGWFTSVYPVILDASYGDDLSRQIKVTKEMLRRVPNRGIGYGLLKYMTAKENRQDVDFKLRPQISFNYLGQFEATLKQMPFRIARESTGHMQSLNRQREYEFEILGGIIEGRGLEIAISYSRKQYRAETVRALLDQFQGQLSRIIRYCRQRREQEPTPSDFDYKDLSIEDLESIFN